MNESTDGGGAFSFKPSTVAWATAELVDQPRPLTARGIVYILTAVVVIGLVFSSLFRVAVTVEAPGAIATEAALLPVRTVVNFKVSKLLVRETQQVHHGDLLLVSEDELSEEGYAKLRSETHELVTLLARDQQGVCAECLERMERLESGGFTAEDKALLKDVVSPVQGGLHEFLIQRKDYASLPSLVEGLKNQIKLDSRKLEEIAKRKAGRILEMDVERLKQEILNDRSQIAEKEQTLRTQLQQARSHLEVSLASFEASLNQYHGQHSLIAPIDATVTHLQVSGAGQLLTPGQEVLSLVPLDSRFIAELDVANKDISRIRTGMEVRLKLDALPEREFGALSGTVRSVPATTASGSDLLSANSERTYKVRVQLVRQSLTKGGAEYFFKHAMTLTGNIITGHYSLLTLGVRKLLNLKDDLFHD